MTRSASTWRFPTVLWRAFQRLNLPPAALLRHAGLPASIATDPGHRLSTEQAFAIWDAVEALSKDPLLGFKLLKAASRVGTDTTFLAATRMATFRDALDSYIRSRRMHSPARISIDAIGDTIRYTRHIPGAARPEPFIAVDFTLGTLLSLGRVGTAQVVNPVRVELIRVGPRLPFHQTFFDTTVCYGAPRNAISFRRDDLDLPLISHDAEAVEALTASINASIAERMASEAIEDAVKEAIRQVLIDRKPNIASVARRLGISERSLQRRVSEKGSTFRELLATARLELAKNMLLEPKARVDAVAYRLRYSNPATFYRAFRTWEGVSPGRWKSNKKTVGQA